MARLVPAAFAAVIGVLFALTNTSLGAEDGADRAVRITFVGDVCFDGNPGHAVVHGEDPFAAVADVLKDTDLAVANLECAVPTAGAQGTNSYSFKAPTECVAVLKRYFSAVSLANNHSGDWGKEGFASELDLLEREKLPYFGGGRNLEQARRPVVLTAHGRRIALLGYCDFPPRHYAAGANTPGTAWLVEADVLADIRAARTREHADTVIPFLHWGAEHRPMPDDYQVTLARKMIDAGADAVIGAHPHIPQTVDWYRGKPIVYSLGNFVFNYFPRDPPKYFGWIVRLTIEKDGRIDMRTIVVKLESSGLPRLVTRRDKVN
jgi:poly-gamma-glutamate synthesis protein (capsule biosynthesis protein)